MTVVILALVLSGCDGMPQSHSEREIREIAQAEAIAAQAELDVRISALEAQLAVLKKAEEANDRYLTAVGNMARSNYDAHESLRKTFNHNVDLDNKEKVRQMTKAGACGREVIEYDDGGRIYRNKECTLKDLKGS